MEKLLKGDIFKNRYRFTGTLRTITPLQIGSGEISVKRLPPKKQKDQREKPEEPPEVGLVMKDMLGRPFIPGSSLKGVMRHWLLHVLSALNQALAANTDYNNGKDKHGKSFSDMNQKEQIEFVRKEASVLELLFGTPFHEGKIEVWDATCLTKDIIFPENPDLLHWDHRSLTYVETSVAIDPDTGTALEHLLYNTEIVPPGIEFELNIMGQNLDDVEVGLILLALQGFNSVIYPIHVGARDATGRGRLKFIPGPFYRLQQGDELRKWLADSLQAFDATVEKKKPSDIPLEWEMSTGFFTLERQLSKSDQQKMLEAVKDAIDGKLNHGKAKQIQQ